MSVKWPMFGVSVFDGDFNDLVYANGATPSEARAKSVVAAAGKAPLMSKPEFVTDTELSLPETDLSRDARRERLREAMKPEFRVGSKVERTIYQNDKLIGMMDTPELATMAVDALNVIGPERDMQWQEAVDHRDRRIVALQQEIQNLRNALALIAGVKPRCTAIRGGQ